MMRMIAIEHRDGVCFRTYEHDRLGIVETFSLRSVTYICPRLEALAPQRRRAKRAKRTAAKVTTTAAVETGCLL